MTEGRNPTRGGLWALGRCSYDNIVRSWGRDGLGSALMVSLLKKHSGEQVQRLSGAVTRLKE